MVVYLSDPSFVIRPGGTERSEKGAGEQVKRCLQIKGNQEEKIPQVNTAQTIKKSLFVESWKKKTFTLLYI